MSRFLEHFRMDTDDVCEFVFENTQFFPNFEDLRAEEIGDGNINYVFRVMDIKTKKTIIVKHADIQTRVRPDGYLSLARCKHEADVLKLQFEVAPDFVPEVYEFFAPMASITMEDIGDYSKLRDLFLRFDVVENLGERLAEFLVNAELPFTSFVCKTKQTLSTKFPNESMCNISKDLVFTHPYKDVRGRNILTAENKEWLENHFYNNAKLLLATSELRLKFENTNESLIHGDLHTGSIFVKSDTKLNVKIIDPEFAFFGPIAYDLGNVIAHFIFAKYYAQSVNVKNDEENKKRHAFAEWISNEIKMLVSAFRTKAIAYLKVNAMPPLFNESIVINNYIDNIVKDSYKFAGAEINRRVIGSAKVEELKNIKDINAKIKMERELVLLGTSLMLGEANGVD